MGHTGHPAPHVREPSCSALHFSRPDDSITSVFSCAMRQIKIPKTALAVTSAAEYPTCSNAVALEPERPMPLSMYTNGYVSHDTAVKYRADAIRLATLGGCFFVASARPK